MNKLAKDIVKGDVIKIEWGAAPFPTWHEVRSVHEDGEGVQIEIKTTWGEETIDFEQNEIVEVRE
jgi:hypothetical protein